MLKLETERLLSPLQPSAPPLRIRLLSAETSVSRWAAEFRTWLERVPGLEVSSGFRKADEQNVKDGGRLFQRWERFARASFDPFGPGIWEPTPASPPDLEIWLGTGVPIGSTEGRFGALSVQFGEGDRWPPYWHEASTQDEVSRAIIAWHDGTWQERRIVAEAELTTRPSWVFTRNAEEPLVAVARMLGEVCYAIRAGQQHWVATSRAVPAKPWTPPAWCRPHTMETLAFAGRQAVRSARYRLLSRKGQEGWFIALRPKGGTFEPIPLPRGSQMADPFLIEVDGHTWLFYEDVPTGSRKGRLAVLEVLGSGRYGEPAVILERPFHLSYPLLVQDRGERFLMPEGFDGGALELYRATRFPHQFQLETTILHGLENGLGVDTTPVKVDGIWYFFTTTPEPFLETLLFWSDRLDGRWRLHPASPISRSVRNCRPAGAVFRKDGRLLRPSQDCSVRYGYSMTIREILRITPQEYEEREWLRIMPDWLPGLLGTPFVERNGALRSDRRFTAQLTPRFTRQGVQWDSVSIWRSARP